MGDFNIFHHMPWSSTYSIYFFVIGISAALFFFSTLSWYRPGIRTAAQAALSMLSFVLLVLGGLLLIGDLSQPLRFLNILNPAYLNFASPLAWGGLNLVSFGAVSVAYFWMMRKNDEANEPQAGGYRARCWPWACRSTPASISPCTRTARCGIRR